MDRQSQFKVVFISLIILYDQETQNQPVSFTTTAIITAPRSKNEPTIVAKITAAATRKSQYLKFGLTQRYEMLHNIA